MIYVNIIYYMQDVSGFTLISFYRGVTMKKSLLTMSSLAAFIILGCSGGSGGGDNNEALSSVSLSSASSRIAGYELEVHCSNEFPTEDKIYINTDEVSVNGRESSVLGPQLDSQTQNFKFAVMSTGEAEGNSVISKAVEFSGCGDAQVLSSIVVDASANEIEDTEVTVTLAN